jgi:hypothetical protein
MVKYINGHPIFTEPIPDDPTKWKERNPSKFWERKDSIQKNVDAFRDGPKSNSFIVPNQTRGALDLQRKDAPAKMPDRSLHFPRSWEKDL